MALKNFQSGCSFASLHHTHAVAVGHAMRERRTMDARSMKWEATEMDDTTTGRRRTLACLSALTRSGWPFSVNCDRYSPLAATRHWPLGIIDTTPRPSSCNFLRSVHFIILLLPLVNSFTILVVLATTNQQSRWIIIIKLGGRSEQLISA